MASSVLNNLEEEEDYFDGKLCSRYMPFFSRYVFAVSFLYIFHLILLGIKKYDDLVLKYDPLGYEYIWKEI